MGQDAPAFRNHRSQTPQPHVVILTNQTFADPANEKKKKDPNNEFNPPRT